MKSFKKVLSGIGAKAKHVELDDLLSPLGLRRKASAADMIVPAVSFFLLGGAIGATVTLFLAPSSGRRMREDVEHRISKLRERLRKEQNAQTELPNSISAH